MERENKGFWFLSLKEKRDAIKTAVEICFGKDAKLDSLRIAANYIHGYVNIHFYGCFLLNVQLDAFSKYLICIGASSGFSISTKQNADGTYYYSIVYAIHRNK